MSIEEIIFKVDLFPTAIQIHYNGSVHWVASSSISGEVKLYDSKAGAKLLSSMEGQLAAIYGGHTGSGDGMMVTRISAQQQQEGVDCGFFSTAFAFQACASR